MKSISAIIVFMLCIYSSGFTQSLDIGIGATISEYRTYQTPVELDSMVFYERDFNGGGRIIFSAKYRHPINDRLQVSLGIQTHSSTAGLTVEKRGTDSTYFNKKLTSAGLTAFELPIAGYYTIAEEENFRLEVSAGVIPVFAKIAFDPIYKEGPQYPASVAEALNKAGTLPKNFYMDYLVGGRLSYKRFNVDIFYQSNITPNLNNNFAIWGSEFLFKRNTHSTRLILSYSIPLTKPAE